VEVKSQPPNTKTRLDFFPKNLKDSTVWSREKTMKSEPWEAKFKELNKIFDFRPLSKANLLSKLTSINLNLKSITQNQKPTGKKYKNWCLKTINLAIKSEMHKKISDFLLHKSVNWTMSLKSHVTKMKPFKSDSNKLAQMLEEELLILKTRLDC